MIDSIGEIAADRLAGYERKVLLLLYERMVLIREFEERVKFLFLALQEYSGGFSLAQLGLDWRMSLVR
jgi:TPP-dependent pyruvate/acetoin dehydrogenase alpha subunit